MATLTMRMAVAMTVAVTMAVMVVLWFVITTDTCFLFELSNAASVNSPRVYACSLPTCVRK